MDKFKLHIYSLIFLVFLYASLLLYLTMPQYFIPTSQYLNPNITKLIRRMEELTILWTGNTELRFMTMFSNLLLLSSPTRVGVLNKKMKPYGEFI